LPWPPRPRSPEPPSTFRRTSTATVSEEVADVLELPTLCPLQELLRGPHARAVHGLALELLVQGQERLAPAVKCISFTVWNPM